METVAVKESYGVPVLDVSEKEEEAFSRHGFRVIFEGDSDLLGCGNYSKVFKASRGAQSLACKVIDFRKTSVHFRDKMFPRELKALQRLRHPHIINCVGVFTVGKSTLSKVFLFMEPAEGDLTNKMRLEGQFTEWKAKKYFIQIASAVEYMHRKKWAHRDLKSDNMLITSAGKAKLTDFGFAIECAEDADGRRFKSREWVGTKQYKAPELIDHKPYDCMQVDVWAMGITLFALINTRLPFRMTGRKRQEISQQQRNRGYLWGQEVGNTCSHHVKDLVDKMLEPDPQRRLTIKQVLSHPWSR